MTRFEVPERLRRMLAEAGPASFDAPTADCLDDDLVAAMADGRLDQDMRAAVLPHVAACVRCHRTVASVARALADPAVAMELAAANRARPGKTWRIVRIAVPLAAAAGLIVTAVPWPFGSPPAAPSHRAPTITTLPAPAPVAPVGAVTAVPHLAWTSVTGADRYRVTLFDREGAVLFETELADTIAAVPDSVELVPERRYLWKVEARTGLGRWTSSDLVEFSLPAPPAP